MAAKAQVLERCGKSAQKAPTSQGAEELGTDCGPESVQREQYVERLLMCEVWNISVNKAQLKNKHEEINHALTGVICYDNRRIKREWESQSGLQVDIFKQKVATGCLFEQATTEQDLKKTSHNRTRNVKHSRQRKQPV